MSRRLVVRPQVRLELAEASDWYDAHNPSLGDELLRTFGEAMESIANNPFQFQIIQGKARRASLKKFPYGLIYIVSDDEIVIVACIHGSRDPKRWQSRIR